MRYLGHPTARVTKAGADGGVDVAAAEAFAQVKMKTGATSRPEVQQLVGAIGRGSAARLFFFSFGGYTRDALAFAEGNEICAYTLQLDGGIEPESRAARAALDAAPGYAGPDEDIDQPEHGRRSPARSASPSAQVETRPGTRLWCSICERSVPGNADGSAPRQHKARRGGVLYERGWRCNGVDEEMIPSR